MCCEIWCTWKGFSLSVIEPMMYYRRAGYLLNRPLQVDEDLASFRNTLCGTSVSDREEGLQATY